MIIDGKGFKNSATCYGQSFSSPNALLDMAEITICGRYPESGWAKNRESHEMVRVMSGIGYLAIRGDRTISLEEGVIVSIPPNEWFAWQSRGSEGMKLLIACSPAFSSAQYEIKDEV